MLTVLLCSLAQHMHAQNWSQSAVLDEPSASSSALKYGASVDIDGIIAVVGAPSDNEVHVYELKNNVWTFLVSLEGSDTGVGDNFGHSVAIEGDVIVVGAYFAGGSNQGQVYIWERPPTGWSNALNETHLISNPEGSFGRFGNALDLKGDKLLIGAPDQTVGGISGHGRAYLYSKSLGAASWTTATLEADFYHPVSASDHLGESVTLNDDYIAVGAPQTGAIAGNAFIFEKGAFWSSKTTADAVLRKPNRSTSDEFGSLMTSTNDVLVVSAGNLSNPAEDIYVYRVPGSWSAEYLANGTLEPDYLVEKSSTSVSLTFGSSLDIQENLLFIGDEQFGTNNSERFGKIWVYELGATSATLVDELLPTSGQNIGNFGSSVASSEGIVFVGAKDYNTAGQAFVFEGSYNESTSDVICFGSSYVFGSQIISTAGNYTETFTATNDLDSTVNLTLTVNPQLNFAFNFDPILCNGETGGITFDSPTGGDGGPYEYSVDGGASFQASPIFTGLQSGALNLVLRDGAGCTRSETTFLQEPAALAIVSTTLSSITCNGANDASVVYDVNGGSGGYYYSLNGIDYTYNGAGINTQVSISNLAPGNYSIRIRDANDCEISTGLSFSEPNELIIGTATPTHVTCNGLSDGSVTFNVQGGTLGYYYSTDGINYTSNGNGTNTTVTFSGLAAGNQMFYIKDENDCEKTTQFEITEPSMLGVAINFTDVTCFGAMDGTFSAVGFGGTAPYEYSFDGGLTYGSTQTATGLGPGQHDVFVRDANACVATAVSFLFEPTELQLGSVTTTDVTCNGESSGSITVSASGGTPIYFTSLDDITYTPFSSSTTSTIDNVAAGAFTLYVKDLNDCVKTFSGIIAEPSALIMTANTNPVSCFGGSDGVINSISISGGNGPYSYSLDNVNFQTSGDLTGLSAGVVTVYVKDANDCVISEDFTISGPTEILISGSETNPSTCNATDGSIAVTINGGTPSYVVSLPGVAAGQSTNSGATFSGLGAGVYTIQVVDANGCTVTQAATLSDPSAATVSVSQTNLTCFAENDGSITVNASGGTTPYEYSLDGGSFQSNNEFTGLAVGSYTVSMREANGCEQSVSVTLTEPAILSVSTQTTDLTCFESADGTFTLTASGGTGSYSYSLDGSTFAPFDNGSSTTISGLVAGSYNWQVRDANDCTISGSNITISQPNEVTATSTVSDASCQGSLDGSISIATTNGVQPFSYSLDGGTAQSSNDFTQLDPGTYSIEVSDANGCGPTLSVTVGAATLITATATTSDATCAGGADGSLDVSATGGATPYEYSLDGTTFQTASTFSGLPSGNYSITIRDSNGCVGIASGSIDEPTQLVVSVVQSGRDFSVSATGGTGPYEFSLDGSTFQSSGEFDELDPGSITFTVRDANGCEVTSSTFDVVLRTIDPDAEIYPNPIEKMLRIDGIKFTRLMIYDLNGKHVFESERKGSYDLGELSSGLFILKLYSEDQLVHEQKIIRK